MSTDAAIVEYLDLLPLVSVLFVGYRRLPLGSREIRLGMRAIAVRLVGRLATTAKRHLWRRSTLFTQPVPQIRYVRSQIRAIERDFDFRLRIRLW